MKIPALLVLSLLFTLSESQIRPNILFILTDDQGYGDVSAYNPAALFTTPHTDKLAESGIMFTDAHSPWAHCMPSRYGLLTGRFPFRGPDMGLWREQPLIDQGRMTMASVLRDSGYHTGMVGKWHLGFDYSDYNNLTGGPVDRGFDYYFGISRSLDQENYYYIENRAATQPPTIPVAESPGTGSRGTQGAFWREGFKGSDFEFQEVMYKFRDHSLAYMEQQAADTSSPFFLYLALAGPHSPWLPSEEFSGTTPLGMYGDWNYEIDHVIGQVVQKVYDLGLREETLIIFSSDNGPNWWPENVSATGHSASFIYQGSKFSVYEGGHRIPFIASWPGVIPAGTKSSQLFNFTDILATFAAITGTPLPDTMAEDSYNLWPALLNPNLPEPVRKGAGLIGEEDYIRRGNWKLVANNELYRLDTDPSEMNNIIANHPDTANVLKALRTKIHEEGRSTPTSRPAEKIIFGCMDSNSPRYVPGATAQPEGSCLPPAGLGIPQDNGAIRIQIHPGNFRIEAPQPFQVEIKNLMGKSLYSGQGNPGDLFSSALFESSGWAIISVRISPKEWASKKVFLLDGHFI